MNYSNGTDLNLTSFFTPKEIICRSDIRARDDIIMELLKRLAYNRGIGSVETAFKEIIQREETHHTIISKGLALPHARLDSINSLVIAIATSESGIRFGRDDSTIARLIILILAPKDTPALYLQVLSSISQLFAAPDTVDKVLMLQSPEDIWNFFNSGKITLSGFVTAGDIMTPVPAVLKENDTLKDAIDLFVAHDLTDLPVIDKDGDLVGVVTAFELLKVCLPDYILWMEDLSPILNFEPFADVLRNESNTWLTEIMSQEYAFLSIDSPAIDVAEEIMKKNTRLAYVVTGKKLAGVITLQHFLDKVLRE
ncbi:MAG: CBS domain-containing protein [Chitinivibrionales bacterium]|nr:CBS domain-containing protein [Chitinivibrionales bacterium]